MLKWLTCWLTFGLALANEAPFWKSKAKLYERIQDGEVIVSVSSGQNANPPPASALRAGGGGQLRATCDFVFKIMQNYDQLAKASDYIKSAQYDAKAQVVKLRIEAFSYKADIGVEVKPTKPPSKALDFRVVQGPMSGFNGRVDFTDLPKNKCEAGFSGNYVFDAFPIPKLFLAFGLEVIFQRMAIRLRGYVEDEYKSTLRKVEQ